MSGVASGIALQCNARCNTMRYMSEVRNRSVRLDDENYEWLTRLPGRSLNEAIERVRTTAADHGGERRDAIGEVLELVRALPDAGDIEGVLRNVIQEFKAQKAGSTQVSSTAPSVEAGFPVQCAHCGGARRGSTKFATICFGCKSSGHTNEPRDCPKCTIDYGTGAL